MAGRFSFSAWQRGNATTAPTVIITGGSKGLGLATVSILLELGCNVFSISRKWSPQLKVFKGLHSGLHSNRLEVFLGDVSKDRVNQVAVKECIKKFGHLDAVICNAARIDFLGQLKGLEGRMRQLRETLDLNVGAVVSLLSYALPHLLSGYPDADGIQGRVVLVSSQAAVKPTVGMVSYNISKSAVNAIARTLALEEPTLSVVAIDPGPTETQMQGILRRLGREHLHPEHYELFIEDNTERLSPPKLPGRSFASLAVAGAFHGSFVRWDDDEVLAVVEEVSLRRKQK